MILSHDMPEIILGDVISPLKTKKHAVEEWDAAVEIASEHAPRVENFHEKFWRLLEKYELDRTGTPFIGNSWLVKGLDALEAQLYIFDKETRGKLEHMRVLSREEVRNRFGAVMHLFPILGKHFDALEQKFIEEKLP